MRWRRPPLKTLSHLVFPVVLAIVIVFSFLPPSLVRMPRGRLLNDKTLHFASFFILSLSLSLFLSTGGKHRLLYALIAFLFSSGAGILIECLQPYMGRVADMVDVLSNILGSMAGISLSVFIQSRILADKKPDIGDPMP